MKTLKITASEIKPGDVIASGTYAGQVVTAVNLMHGSLYMTYRTEKVQIVTSQNTPVVVEREVPTINEVLHNELVASLMQCRNMILYGGASFDEKTAAVTRANAALTAAGVV